MSGENDFADPPSPWTRPWFVVSAVFLALVVALGVVVALRSDDDTPGSADAPPPAAPSAGASASTPSPTASSVLPTALPTRPPSGVRWQLVGQNAVPVSESA